MCGALICRLPRPKVLFETQASLKPNQIQSFSKPHRFDKLKLNKATRVWRKERFFSQTLSSSLGAYLFTSYFCKDWSATLSLSKDWLLDKFYLSCFQTFI